MESQRAAAHMSEPEIREQPSTTQCQQLTLIQLVWELHVFSVPETFIHTRSRIQDLLYIQSPVLHLLCFKDLVLLTNANSDLHTLSTLVDYYF